MASYKKKKQPRLNHLSGSSRKHTCEKARQKTDPYSEEKNGEEKCQYRFHIRLRSFRHLFVCAYSGKESGLGWQVN